MPDIDKAQTIGIPLLIKITMKREKAGIDPLQEGDHVSRVCGIFINFQCSDGMYRRHGDP
jgi:hypothetical protein